MQDLAIDPAEQMLVIGMFEHPIQIWNLATGQLLHSLTDHHDGIDKIQIHPDGKTFTTISSIGKHIFVWDMNSGHWLHSIKDGELWILSFPPMVSDYNKALG